MGKVGAKPLGLSSEKIELLREVITDLLRRQSLTYEEISAQVNVPVSKLKNFVNRKSIRPSWEGFLKPVLAELPRVRSFHLPADIMEKIGLILGGEAVDVRSNPAYDLINDIFRITPEGFRDLAGRYAGHYVCYRLSSSKQSTINAFHLHIFGYEKNRIVTRFTMKERDRGLERLSSGYVLPIDSRLYFIGHVMHRTTAVVPGVIYMVLNEPPKRSAKRVAGLVNVADFSRTPVCSRLVCDRLAQDVEVKNAPLGNIEPSDVAEYAELLGLLKGDGDPGSILSPPADEAVFSNVGSFLRGI